METKSTLTGTETKVYNNHRGITKDVNKLYRFATHLDGDGNAVARTYTYPSQTQLRILPKDFTRNKGFKAEELGGSDLFNAGSSQVLTITEGAEDAASAYQMLGCKMPVVWLPNATPSKKFLEANYKYINSFKEIVMCTDNDEAGQRVAMKFAEIFPNKVFTVNLTKYKDANEFLTNGATSEFMFAHINRQKYVPEFDTSTTSGFLKILEESKDAEYIPTGLTEFDEEMLGLMQGHVTVFQAPEGVGKTELMRYLEYNLTKNHPDVAFAALHLEEPQVRSILGLVSYDLEKNVTRKDLIEDMDEVTESITNMTKSNNLHLFSISLDEDPMVLIDRIQYYANVCECKYIFIEPIQDLAHQNTSGATTEQFLTKLSVLMSRVAASTGVGIITIAHENDDGQIRDCRMIGKQASVVVRLERDKDSDDEELKNTTVLRTLKNRPTSTTGYSGSVFFDKDSFTIKEV
tara:strand:+ start:1315 stop:2700 length:1386 start_codon:yes stop_codon:yes gene_type:complete